jgi:hypothetical protein
MAASKMIDTSGSSCSAGFDGCNYVLLNFPTKFMIYEN